MTAGSFSEIMKEEANKLAGKTKEEAPVLSTEDQLEGTLNTYMKIIQM